MPLDLPRLDVVARAASARPSRSHRKKEPEFWLRVRVREITFSLHCADGRQDFSWVANCAKCRYASHHQISHVERLIPLDVLNDKGTSLWPFEIIRSLVNSNDEIVVLLYGPQTSGLRLRTLWELYAFSPKESFEYVTIIYDCREHPGKVGAPRIIGNFNSWTSTEPMSATGDPNIWTYHIWAPPGAVLQWNFVRSDEMYLTSKNYIEANHRFGDLVNTMTVGKGNNERVDNKTTRMTMPVVTAEVQRQEKPSSGVKKLSDGALRDQFESDWTLIQLADFIPNKAERDQVKQVLWSFYETIIALYRFRCTFGSGDVMVMTLLKWIAFCRDTKIIGGKVTVSALDSIFVRVNVEESLDEGALDANQHANSLSIVQDPMNPNHAFVRYEFMEALVRVAFIKYEEDVASVRLNNLILNHVTNAMTDLIGGFKIRLRILAEPCQEVFTKYRNKLNRDFSSYKNKIGQGNTECMSYKGFEKLMVDSGIMNGSDNSNGPISRRVVATAFTLAQDETHGTSNSSDSTSNQHLKDMTYLEFLEGLTRIAEVRENGEHLHEKIAALLETMIENSSSH